MDVTQLHDQLAQRAFLHDDPDAYLAGVRDALEVLDDDEVAVTEQARGRLGA
jgi:hypothetical protein